MIRRRGTPIAVCALALVLAVVLLGVVGAAIAAGPSCSGCTPRLAFTKTGRSGDEVWASTVAGRHAHRLGPGDIPLMAPSGQLVAAELNGARAALIVYGNGTNLYVPFVHRFFKASQVGAQPVAFSPDSRYLAVELLGTSPGKRDRFSGLAVIDTATFTAKVIANGSICGASFAPTLPVRLVYAKGPAGTFCLDGHVNIFEANPDGSRRHQITTDGRSLNPVWGPTKIAFDRAQLRKGDAPAFQIWLMNPDGSGQTQLTHAKVPQLLEGFVPIQFSSNGERLLAEYEGQDTSEAWTIQVATQTVRQVKVKGVTVTAGGLSQDGSTVLVDYNGFLNPPSAGTVETVPFGGGPAKVLVRHAGFPSWNR